MERVLIIMINEEIKIKVVAEKGVELPVYQTPGAAGMDLRAWLPEGPVSIGPGERRLIPTGLRIEIPFGHEVQVRPRSGLALKKGLTVLNSPGTIDSDYRGEVGVILVNLGQETVELENGERVAQMVVAPVSRAVWESVPSLDISERGEGGFGHTGHD